MSISGKLAEVKRLFFTYRNGIVSDVYRRSGSPYRMIFGLTLAQVADIAKGIGYDKNLAYELLHDNHVRESAMLAPMLVDPDEFCRDEVITWAKEIKSTEIADIFALKLLRKTSYLKDIVEELCHHTNDDMSRYIGLRGAFGLTTEHPDFVIKIAQNELSAGCSLTSNVAGQLLDMCHSD